MKKDKKNTLMLVSGIIFLVSIILFFVLPGWFLLGLVFFVICGAVAAFIELKKRYETRCSKCKKEYDYDSEVSWKFVKEFTKGASSANSTLGQLFYQYEFVCHCSACDTKKKYYKNIEVAKITDKGNYEERSPEEVIESAFVKKEITWGQAVVTSVVCLGFSILFIIGGIFFAF